MAPAYRLHSTNRHGGFEKCGLDRFVPIEPIVEGADPVEDDLTRELRLSALTNTEEIIQCLDSSADAFRGSDFNGCLSNARVALQTLASSIARVRLLNHPKEI